MKKSFLLILSVFAIFTAYSQSVPGKWMIKKYGISLGVEQDRIKNMDADYFLNSAKGTDNSLFRQNDLGSQDLFSGVCENPHIHAYVTLGIAGEERFNLDLGLIGVFNRYDAVFYHKAVDSPYSWDAYSDYEYLDLSAFSHEISVEAVLNRKLNVTPWFALYGGVGTNAGYTIGEYMYAGGTTAEAIERSQNRSTSDIYMGQDYNDPYFQENHFNEYYELRDAFSQRAFATAGVGFTICKRVEVGMNFTRGIGYRAHFGAGTRMINLHSSQFRINWVMRK